MDKFFFIITFIIINIPSITLLIVGNILKKDKPELSKILFIVGGVYITIALGICFTLVSELN